MSTVVELRKEAKEKGLKGYSKMKKAELIELLKEGEKNTTKPVKKKRMKKIKDIVMTKEDEGRERTLFINQYLDAPFVYQILNGEVYIVGEAQEREYGGFDVIKDYKKKVPSNVRFYNPRGKPVEKLNKLLNGDDEVIIPKPKKPEKTESELMKDILEETKTMSERELEYKIDDLKDTYLKITNPWYNQKKEKFKHPASFYLKIGAALLFPKIQDELKKGYFSTVFSGKFKITEDIDIRELYNELRRIGKGGWTLNLIDTITEFKKFLPENILEIIEKKERKKERKEKEEKEKEENFIQKQKEWFEIAKKNGFL